MSVSAFNRNQKRGKKSEGGECYRNKNKFRCQVSRIEKHLVKIKEKIW